MAEHDDRAQTDITDPILDRHGDVRRRFEKLWKARTSGDAGAIALDAAWQPIASLLDSHANAVAALSRPTVLDSIGSPEAAGSTFPAV